MDDCHDAEKYDQQGGEWQRLLEGMAIQAPAKGEGEEVDWKKMKEEYPDIKVMTFPEPVLKAMKGATEEVLAGYGAENAEFKEVYESRKAYRDVARQWTKVSDQYYLETAEKVGE